jgi:hypothetical protein
MRIPISKLALSLVMKPNSAEKLLRATNAANTDGQAASIGGQDDPRTFVVDAKTYKVTLVPLEEVSASSDDKQPA